MINVGRSKLVSLAEHQLIVGGDSGGKYLQPVAESICSVEVLKVFVTSGRATA